MADICDYSALLIVPFVQNEEVTLWIEFTVGNRISSRL